MPTPRPPYDVVVQDPHAPSRLGLAGLLRLQPWVGRCDAASDQAGALRLIREHRPHVAVVDVSASGTFASDHCDALRRAHPGIAVVATARCGRGSAPAAAGADGGAEAWIEPDATVRQIVSTVRAAAERGGAVAGAHDGGAGGRGTADGAAAEAAGDPTAREASAARETLTEREAQVLRLLARGATNPEIAAELHLSPHAIKKYASAVYRKLGVRNRTEAARRLRGG